MARTYILICRSHTSKVKKCFDVLNISPNSEDIYKFRAKKQVNNKFKCLVGKETFLLYVLFTSSTQTPPTLRDSSLFY